MVVHFICRGNTFRSIIAEAYLKSLQIKDLKVHSSGTVAAKYKLSNKKGFKLTLDLLKKHKIEKFAKDHHGDQLQQSTILDNEIVVCLNENIYDESKNLVKLPKNIHIWKVSDLGEPGYIVKSPEDREKYMEEIYKKIIKNVNDFVKKTR